MSVALIIVGVIVPGPLVDRTSASLDAHVIFSDLVGNESHTVGSAVVVRATGIGYPPPRMRGARARLMARRAAEIVAVRNLATKFGHGRRARIRGFRYVSTTFRPDGSVEVIVEHLKY